MGCEMSVSYEVEMDLIKHWIKLLPYVSSGMEREAREALREIIASYVELPVILSPQPDSQFDRGMINPYKKPLPSKRLVITDSIEDV